MLLYRYIRIFSTEGYQSGAARFRIAVQMLTVLSMVFFLMSMFFELEVMWSECLVSWSCWVRSHMSLLTILLI